MGSVFAAVVVALLNGWSGIAVGMVHLALTAWLWRGPKLARREGEK